MGNRRNGEARKARRNFVRIAGAVVLVLVVAVVAAELRWKVVQREWAQSRFLSAADQKVEGQAWNDWIAMGRPPAWQLRRFIRAVNQERKPFVLREAPLTIQERLQPTREAWTRTLRNMGYRDSEIDELLEPR